MQCEAWKFKSEVRWKTRCTFTNVTFNQDTKLNIERIGFLDLTDADIKEVAFYSSSISLVHPDILAKFPNIKEILLSSENELKNPEKFENCREITELDLELDDFTGISSDTFADCKKLETATINVKSLTDLPNGLFKNQENLRSLELKGKNLKLRVSSFEGLTSLSELELRPMKLSHVEENFFRSLKIKKLHYYGKDKGHSFPIESLNSQETIEELEIRRANLSSDPETLGSILRSIIQLKKIDFSSNSIGSVEAFVDLPNIEEISLADNKIEELPASAFRGCPRLSILRLYFNPIKVLRGDEFNQLIGLKELDLLETKLASIAPTTFHPLKSLETLDLSELFTGTNNTISKELFMYSTNLRSLRLDDLNIQAIHPEAFANLHKLIYLSLSGNKCVDTYFRDPEVEPIDMTLVKEKLQTCFENFSNQEAL